MKKKISKPEKGKPKPKVEEKHKQLIRELDKPLFTHWKKGSIIPVKNGGRTTSRTVLIYAKNIKSIFDTPFVSLGFYNYETKCWVKCSSDSVPKVDYWMDIPYPDGERTENFV